MSELLHDTTESEYDYGLESDIFSLIIQHLRTSSFQRYPWERLATIYENDPHRAEILGQYIHFGTDEQTNKRLGAHMTLATIEGRGTVEYEQALVFLDTIHTDLTSQITLRGALLSLPKDSSTSPEQFAEDAYTPRDLVNGYLELDQPLKAWESAATLRHTLGNNYPIYLARVGQQLCQQRQFTQAAHFVKFLKSIIPPSYNPDSVQEGEAKWQLFNEISAIIISVQAEISRANSGHSNYMSILEHTPPPVREAITEEPMKAYYEETARREERVVELYLKGELEQALEALPDIGWSRGESLATQPVTILYAIAELSAILSRADHAERADDVYKLAKHYQHSPNDECINDTALLELVRAYTRSNNLERAFALVSTIQGGYADTLFDNIARELLAPGNSQPNTSIIIKPESLGAALDVILININNPRSQQKAIETLMFFVSKTGHVTELQTLNEIHTETFEQDERGQRGLMRRYRHWLMQCAYNAGDMQLAVGIAKESEAEPASISLLFDILESIRRE